MADSRTRVETPRWFWLAVLLGAIAIVGIAIAAAATIEKPLERLAGLLFPYPLIALVAAMLIAWIAARLRHASAVLPWNRLRLWILARLAFIAATTLLLLAVVVAELLGGSATKLLVDALLLAVAVHVIIYMVGQCAVDAMRAIRGPASPGP